MSPRPPLLTASPHQRQPAPASGPQGPVIPPRYTGPYFPPAVQPASAPRPAPRSGGSRRARLPRSLRNTPGPLLGFCALLLVAATALVGQVVWERWGSDMYADRRQDQLAAAFASASAAFAGAPTPVAAATPAAPALTEGQLARLRIPDIGVDIVVVPGVSRAELRNGAGWDQRTVFPGTPGNALIAGHRTTYGSPFRELDELTTGSRILVDSPGRPTSVFEVRSVMIVNPGDTWVRRPSDGVRLTLTTCHPEGDDRQRLVVQAELVEGEHAAVAVPADRWAPSTPA